MFESEINCKGVGTKSMWKHSRCILYSFLLICILFAIVPGCSAHAELSDSGENRMATVYFVDDASAEMTEENCMVQDEYDIWNILQEKGVLSEDCKLLSLLVDEQNKKLDLDFNRATGERIRSMGTTGETEIIGCLINTYLDAYDCDIIRLTEEGDSFETSHGAVFDGYEERMDFKD